MDNILIFIEYAGLPIFLVLITFFLKNLLKDKSMTTLNEYYSIAFDIILVCTVGISIYGLSIFNHYKSDKVQWFVVITLVLGIFLLGLTIFLTFFIKQKGEDSTAARVSQVLSALIAIITLVCFIAYGNNNVPHNAFQINSHQINDSTQNVTDSLKSIDTSN